MADPKPTKPTVAKKERKTKNYNVSYIKRKMKEYGGSQYRIAKEAPDVMAGALEKLIREVTMDAATFAMNSGRCTIKARDVQAALGISARVEQKP